MILVWFLVYVIEGTPPIHFWEVWTETLVLALILL